MFSSKIFLRVLYFGHSVSRWNSSSTLFRSHILQSLSFGSDIVPLNVSMFNGWELSLSLVSATLWGWSSMRSKYLSREKLCLNFLYVLSLLPPLFLVLPFSDVILCNQNCS